LIAFWLIAAVMVGAAVLVVAPALLRARSEGAIDRAQQNVAIARERLAELEEDRAAGRLANEEFEPLREELEAALASDLKAEARPAERGHGPSPWPAMAVALLLPVLAGALYLSLGTPGAIDGASIADAGRGIGHPSVGGNGEPASVEEMVARLQARLKEQPDDAGGWVTLGNTFMSMKRFGDAVEAFSRAHALIGDDPRLLVRYADALAMAAGGRIQGKPFELVWRALAADPDNPTALWLAGMGYAEKGEYQQAIAQWQRLEPMLADQPESLAQLRSLIDEARQQLAQAGEAPATATPGAEPAPAMPAQPQKAASGAALSVRVSLDPALLERVAPGDTVFVYARAVEGPPMPLAVVRRPATELPFTVTLDDSMAMMPALSLSRFDTVRVSARVSHSGNAMPQSGDLRGEVSPVKVASSSVIEIVIDEIVQ